MSELDDVATWLNILLPPFLAIGAGVYAYARKASMAATNITELQEQVKNIKRVIKPLLEDKYGKEGIHLKELFEDDKSEE